MDILTLSDVSNIVDKLIKLSSPSELAIKGLHFGRLYFKAGDHQQAVDWIVKYLKKFDRDFQAHRLLGECYEKLSADDAALASYKQSLQIKPNQFELVVHVAELFLNPGPSQNFTKAQVWLDKAAAALPGDPKVFKMKGDCGPLNKDLCFGRYEIENMELLLAQQAPSKTLENALLKELKIRPSDASLYEQYVTFLKTQGRLNEAFCYCRRIRNLVETDGFESDYKWLSCEVKTYKDFIDTAPNKDPMDDCMNHCLLLEALSQLIWLCIKENKDQKVFSKFAMMDEYLASLTSRNVPSDWQLLIDEIKGQCLWIAGTLLLYRAQQSKVPWKEACGLALFFYSYSLSKPLLSMSSSWAVSSCRSLPKFPLRLYKNSAIRLSQSSHMVWILREKLGDDVLDSAATTSAGRTAHRHLCENSDENTSFIVTLQVNRDVRPVPVLYMSQYDELAALSRDLHRMVWIGLRWMQMEEPSDFLPWSVKTFPSLKLNVVPNTSASVLSLNLLDVESFIAGCVFSAKKKLQDWKETNISDPSSLSYLSLPPALCRRLTTDLQDKWWRAASELSSKSSKISVSEASKLKPILQRGLECIRGLGNHGLDTILVTKFAKYFASKAFALLDGDDVPSAWFTYQRKAVSYWTLITPELGRLAEGVVTHRSTKDALFPSVFNEPSSDDAKSFLSEAYMCRGELAAREQNTDDAISFYSKATIPQASYCQAHIYKKLLENLGEKEILEPQVDVNRKKELLMKKYRHCLEVTLTRLQQQPDESLHEKTIRLLSSPHVSPPRPIANKSANGSTSCFSKQSTPKATDSASAAPLIENEAVNNLVDTITTLTSALSSLQLEMECLREENRLVRQSSPAQHYTPLSQGLSPALFHPEVMQRPTQPLTPQHNFPSQSQMLGYGKEGVVGTPAFAQYPGANQQQSYYSPSVVPYASTYGYPPYADNGALLNGGYGSSGYPNPASAQPNQPPSTNTPLSQPQSSNLLSAALQSKDKEVLQLKFGSILSEMGAPLTSVKTDHPSPAQRTDTSANMKKDATPVNKTSNDAFQSLFSQNVAAKTSTLQQLLSSNVSVATTPVSTKEIKPDFKVNLPPQSTPTSKREVHFLEGFISPKSPGTNMKFQSPEQMDRENQELDALEQADADTSTNPDAGPHFEPIIPLPDLVEVKTGEEDEDALFVERCKLFRWDADQWKERGIGTMKLLKHKINGSIRLVMRREQVLKVCCNHYITKSIRLSRMPSCERAMVWVAYDFAEGEVRTEKFAAKFKTVEMAEKFRDLVNGEASAMDKTTNEKPAPKSIAEAAAKFKFEMTPKLNEETAPEPDKSEVSKPSPFSNLASALSGAGFAGSGPNGGIKLPMTKYSFGAPKPKAKEDSMDKGAATDGKNEDILDKEESVEVKAAAQEEDDGPQHQPIIDLPDLVEVKTGEEDEETIFARRAKLYRHVAPEWKERGVGDLKILKHRKTGKYRLVMRREQVMKLCANHHITGEMKLSPQGTTKNTWIWIASDFSESSTEAQQEMFAVRFRTAEEALEFHDVFLDGVAVARNGKSAASASTALPPKSPSQAAGAFLRKELRTNKIPDSSTWTPVTSTIGHDIDSSKSEVSSSSTKPTGFNLPAKPAGSWSCPDCYASNTSSYDRCPCCQCPNPNSSKQSSESDSKPKEEKFIVKFGVNAASSANQDSPFSFGIKQSGEAKPAETAKQHPALQRAGGSKPGGFTPFQFGVTSTNTTSKDFSASPAFGNFQKPSQPEDQQKDTGFDNDEEYYDESDTTETSETYSESDEDEKEDRNIYRSPMSRFSAPQDSAALSVKPENIQQPAEVAKDTTTDHTSATVLSTTTEQFTFGSSSSAPTFSELAAGNNTDGSFSFATSAGKYAGAWKPETLPMFSNLQTTADEDKHNESSELKQENTEEDGIFVTPIVQLPESVVVETGEENETTLFSRRSKLFRWDQESTQWKERGLGEIMIKHSTHADRFRILMRREQVLKVCANHYITPDMKLEPTFGSTVAWTWLAADYADDEEKIERLSIKFKTQEIAQEFKEQFEECQLLLRKKKDEGKHTKDEASVSLLINNAEKMKAELGFFKDKLSVKSNIKLEQTLDEDSASSSSAVKFDPNIQLTPLVKEHEKNKEKQKGSEVKTTEGKSQTNRTSTAKTSLQLDQFDFKIASNSSKTKDVPASSGRMQERNISVCSAASEESQDIAFEPIIPLPAKVNVPTGEENEQIVFEERSKLYIFDRDNQQWKERGIGKIKLLQNLTSFKLRLVMRREQVLKVCLNQLINDETHFEYKEKSGDKIIIWTGIDFSDTDKENGETLQFAIRFKTSEVASEFLRCVRDGIEAHAEKRLLEPVLVQDQSTVSEQAADTTEEASEDQVQSPVRSPVKPAKSLFSFANVASPFEKKNTQFQGFVFGSTPKSNTTNQKPFSFSANTASFSMGATSTPFGIGTQPVQNQASDKNLPVFGASADPSGVFSFSAPKLALGSENVSSPQTQQPEITGSNQSEPVKLCMPGAEKGLDEIQSSSYQDQASHTSVEVEDVSSYLPSSEDSESSSSSSESEVDDDDDDVVFVSQVLPSNEQIERAEDLQLPRSFFLYENLSNEELDSEEEDIILEYMDRRNRGDFYQSDDEEKEEESRDESSLFYQTASQNQDAPVSSLTDHLSSSLGRPQLESSVAEPQQTENIFQTFANMSNFSFAAMAAESGANKHAFGARKDDAFQVSDEKKVLFLNQSEEEQNPDDHDPHYQPVLSELPPLVQVKTGEEDETEIFNERCKLYKFDNDTKSWKERGLGNMKILHHPEFHTYRVVMRREQVLKICANHRILKEMSLMPNGEKAFVYVAQDQSEEDREGKLEKFCVRFKTPEIAEQFRKAWEQAQSEAA